MDEASELLQLLSLAFGGLRIPPEDSLVIDNSGSDWESNEVQNKFRQRHWQDMTIEDLAGEADALPFFTPEAFRFFLPAFIRVSILDWDRADRIPEVILWSLAQPDTDKWWERRQASLLQTASKLQLPEKLVQELATQEAHALDSSTERRLNALNDHQKDAILRFILFLKKCHSEEFSFGELECVERALRPAPQ